MGTPLYISIKHLTIAPTISVLPSEVSISDKERIPTSVSVI